MNLYPSTEIEAVNTMLNVIGEMPVDTLEGIESTDIQSAVNILHNTSRDVQGVGWEFNSESGYPLSPDIYGNIYLPSNTLKASFPDRTMDLVSRGPRVYDRGNHTYVFTRSITCDLSLFLPFEELPQPARTYITIVAARFFQISTLGSETIHRLTQAQEDTAFAALNGLEAEQGHHNILDNWTVGNILSREWGI